MGGFQKEAPVQYEITVDPLAQIWSLAINGVPVPGATDLPTSTGSGVGYVQFSATSAGAAIDDIEGEASQCP